MRQAAVPLGEAPEASYEADFVLWAERQARLLRDGRLGDLDLAHLIGEVEGVGNSHRDEIESRLTALLAHLLKWKHQPGNRSGTWNGTVLEQRRRIAGVIGRAPSLRTSPQEVFPDRYLSGRLDATKKTGFDFTPFPETAPFNLAGALDGGFLPLEPDREAYA